MQDTETNTSEQQERVESEYDKLHSAVFNKMLDRVANLKNYYRITPYVDLVEFVRIVDGFFIEPLEPLESYRVRGLDNHVDRIVDRDTFRFFVTLYALSTLREHYPLTTMERLLADKYFYKAHFMMKSYLRESEETDISELLE